MPKQTDSAPSPRGKSVRGREQDSWVGQELAACTLPDARLEHRLRSLLGQLSDAPGESIPLVCQDWTNTKAAYRFLSNPRVNDRAILSGHLRATRERFASCDGPVLVLHDTTEFTFQRQEPRAIGVLHKSVVGKYHDRLKYSTICGIAMHSSLAVTADGLPLGLAAVKFWTRSRFKGCNALKRTVNPTRVSIGEKESVRWLQNLSESTELLTDPERCIHIGDRASDIYELFCTARTAQTHFIARTCVDRLAGDGSVTVGAKMRRAVCRGLHRIEVRTANGERSQAVLRIKFQRIHVLPPIGKQKCYPALDLTALYAQEHERPRDRARIDWKLISDLPVRSRADALRMLQWYAMRWKIETFHKILKSGCRVEQSRLRSADRLVNLLATFCIVGWRVFWLTMINRCAPHLPPAIGFTATERRVLDQLNAHSEAPRRSGKTVAAYVLNSLASAAISPGPETVRPGTKSSGRE